MTLAPWGTPAVRPAVHALARLFAVATVAAVACGPRAPPRVAGPGANGIAPGRPRLGVVVREGDPASAVAAFVSTQGLEPASGAAPAVALAELFARRLVAWSARVTPQADAVRVELLLSEATATRGAAALRDALLAPVTQSEVAPIRQRLDLLSRLPMPPGYEEAAWCGGDVLAGAVRFEPSSGTVERLRAAAIGLDRVALAVVGGSWAAKAARDALLAGPRWPSGAPVPPPPAAGALHVHEGADPGRVRARLVLRTAAAAAPVAAEWLGRADAPLRARLDLEGSPLALAHIVATVHAGGSGCVAVDLEGEASAVASAGALEDAIALARREAGIAARDAQGARADIEAARAVSAAGDVRDAAAREAAWALASASEPPGSSVAQTTAYVSTPPRPDAPALRTQLEARLAQSESYATVEVRASTEPGQGAVWVLFASTCGTASEGSHDAGVSALVVTAAARGADGQDGVRVEPWFAADGVGVIAHAARQLGETDAALARRVAHVAARALLTDSLAALAPAGAELVALAQDAPGLATLGGALAPAHPSWVTPGGTASGILGTATASVLTRAATLRAGPLRASVLANDPEATRAAATTLDRWAFSATTRACPSPPTAPAVAAGTYAVASSGRSEAWLALPIEGALARASAPLIAAALDGPDGALDRAITRAGLARRAGARVLDGPRAALVVHLEAPAGALDAAVAQARAVLDRLRTTGPTRDDLDRARRTKAAAETAAALDPRVRLVRAWRDPPTAVPGDEAVRAAVTALLRDDALVIVALRPDARAASGNARRPP